MVFGSGEYDLARSVSSIGQEEDDQVSDGGDILPRKAPSFTVHGKKASIVTFGSEWQNMPPEERLKLRKPTPHEEPRASDPTLLDSNDSLEFDTSRERPMSLRSTSTTTGLSTRTNDDLAEFKDAREVQSEEEDIGRPGSPVISIPPPDTDPTDSPISPTTTPGHLHAPRHAGSASSSTSLGERIVDHPSTENLREQAVGA